eukprot:s225_g53.t1
MDPTDPMDPMASGRGLEELLSIILVTSPVPSNPSTEMVEHVLQSMAASVPGLELVESFIVSDGFRVCEKDQKARPKAGRIAAEMVEAYEEYRSRLDAPWPTWPSLQHLRAAEHKGFAGCLHIALRKVTSPYVLVLQHDRPCLRPFDLKGLLEAMQAQPNLKYVGLPTKASLARTGQEYFASQWQVGQDLQAMLEVSLGPVILRPLFLWYDSAHICSVEHYKNLVFRKGRQWSGGFIEDSFGQEMLAALRVASASGNVTEVHEIYGTYLYDDGAGPIVGHLDGRRWHGSSQSTSRKLREILPQE